MNIKKSLSALLTLILVLNFCSITAFASINPVPVDDGTNMICSVVRGDTFYKIAAKYSITLEELIALNPQVKNPSKVYVGDKIIVGKKSDSTSAVPAGTAELPPDIAGVVKQDKTDIDKGFACIVSENGKIYRRTGIDSCADLMKQYHLVDDGSYIGIHVVPDNDEKYPYLYPEYDWKMLVYKSACPSWFTEEMKSDVWSAFEEWKDNVYSIFDYKGLRVVTADDVLDIAPTDAEYKVTIEELAAFLKCAHDTNSLVTYIRESVLGTIQSAVGTSISNDAYNYIQVVRMASDASDKISSAFADAGYVVSNVGVIQSNFFAAICGSYFDIDKWTYYTEESDGYPYASIMYMWEHGLILSQDSNTYWHLHSLDAGQILYTVSDDMVSTKKAFAAVVGKDGTVYWQLGADNVESVKAHFGLTGDDYVEIQVNPVLEKKDAEYVLIDGNNREATIIFPYLDPKSEWTLLVLNEEKPEWYDEKEYESAVMEALNGWKKSVYSGLDFASAENAFTEETRNIATPTNEDIDLLKEWVTVWNNIKDKGVSPTAAITMSGYQSVSSNLWDDFGSYLLSCWRYVHSECPGSVVSSGYAAYAGEEKAADKAIKTFVSDSVSDVWEAVTGYYFSNVSNWEYYDGDVKGYPYAAGAKLVLKNLVPCTDGTNWYLCSGEDAKVVFEISAEDLLARNYSVD